MASAQILRPVILVVDDEAILRLCAVGILEDAGFATLEAGDAQEALAQVSRRPEIAILFTDINMPGPFDGLELAKRVHEYSPRIHLILTSGRQAPTPEDIPNAGLFIPKPYDARQVAEMARTLSAFSGPACS